MADFDKSFEYLPNAKPCPFCGARPNVYDCDVDPVWIQCSGCTVRLFRSTRRKAIASWNRRDKRHAA